MNPRTVYKVVRNSQASRKIATIADIAHHARGVNPRISHDTVKEVAKMFSGTPLKGGYRTTSIARKKQIAGIKPRFTRGQKAAITMAAMGVAARPKPEHKKRK